MLQMLPNPMLPQPRPKRSELSTCSLGDQQAVEHSSDCWSLPVSSPLAAPPCGPFPRSCSSAVSPNELWRCSRSIVKACGSDAVDSVLLLWRGTCPEGPSSLEGLPLRGAAGIIILTSCVTQCRLTRTQAWAWGQQPRLAAAGALQHPAAAASRRRPTAHALQKLAWSMWQVSASQPAVKVHPLCCLSRRLPGR